MSPSIGFTQQPTNDFKKIKWMTEEYAPYNYIENGILKGISVDVLREIWKRSKNTTEPDIEVLPWARGYMYLQKEKNSCLFSTSITDERIKQFIFSSPISDNNNIIIAKKNKRFKIYSLADLKALSIGTVREDAAEQLLVSLGWTIDQLDRTSSAESLVRKLSMNRSDAISYGENTTIYNMKLIGINPDEYERIFLLKKTELCFAFNKDSDPELISYFNTIMEDLRKEGVIEEIKAKYLKSYQL